MKRHSGCRTMPAGVGDGSRSRWFVIAFLSSIVLVTGQELQNPVAVPLEGDTFHVQGIDVDSARLWVTAVDSTARKGYLFEYSLPSGRRLRSIEIQDGARFHPGGIASDETSLWMPVAEYRSNSSAVIERRDKSTLELKARFVVPDHIGCIAVQGDVVAGGNWDSRLLYVWNLRGELQATLKNPTPAAYQDMKFIDGHLVASGMLPDRTSVVDWLDFPSLTLRRRLTPGRSDRGQPYSREGMTIRNGRLYFLPEDVHSRLFIFDLK